MNKALILALLALLMAVPGALGQSSDGSSCSADSDCGSGSVCTVFAGVTAGTCTPKGQLMSRCDDAAPCVSTDFLKLQCLQGFCLPSEDSGSPAQTIPAGGTCAVISNTETCVENYFCNPLSLKCESSTVASCTPNGNECAAGQICVPIATDQGGDGTSGSCITIGGGSDQCSPECGDQEQCISGRCIGLGNGTPGELNGPCLADNKCTNSLAVCVSGVCSLPEDTNVGKPGEIAGPCVDGACNGENRCISNFCLPPEGSSGLGGSPGELGGPCLDGNECSTSSRTTCLAGFCVPQDVIGPIAAGDIGGACLEDGSCNSGATCNADKVCEAGSGGLTPGELGGACLEDKSCNTGLECAFDGTCAQAVDGGESSTGGSDSGSGSDGPCQCLCNGIPIAGFKYNIGCATCATQCRASLFSFCTTLGFGVVNLEGTNRGIVGDRCDPTTDPDPAPKPGELGGSCLAGDVCSGTAVCGDNKICVPQSGNVDTSTGGTGTPATCTTTNPCPTGQRCTTDSVCVALSAAGAACAATTECQTGLFCIDSVCKSTTTGGGTTTPPANAAPGAACVSEPVLAALAFTAVVALLRV